MAAPLCVYVRGWSFWHKSSASRATRLVDLARVICQPLCVCVVFINTIQFINILPQATFWSYTSWSVLWCGARICMLAKGFICLLGDTKREGWFAGIELQALTIK